MKITCRSVADTRKVATQVLADALAAKSDHAVILALHGDLGSGKTTFTQLLGSLLGITEAMQSPTFVIEKRYELVGQAFERLIHIDAYRLDSAEELSKLNFTEICRDPKNLIVIEWGERVESILPENRRDLFFVFIDETTRDITI